MYDIAYVVTNISTQDYDNDGVQRPSTVLVPPDGGVPSPMRRLSQRVRCEGEGLDTGGWPGARAGWLAARVHPVSLRILDHACMI